MEFLSENQVSRLMRSTIDRKSLYLLTHTHTQTHTIRLTFFLKKLHRYLVGIHPIISFDKIDFTKMTKILSRGLSVLLRNVDDCFIIVVYVD